MSKKWVVEPGLAMIEREVGRDVLYDARIHNAAGAECQR